MKVHQPDRAEGGWEVTGRHGQREAGPYREEDDAIAYLQAAKAALAALCRPVAPRSRNG